MLDTERKPSNPNRLALTESGANAPSASRGLNIKGSGRQRAEGKPPSRKKRAAKLKRTLLSWHKRLGIFSAAFVMLLSVTGILLNHTSELHLGRAPAPDLVLPLYGVEFPDVKGVLVNNAWFVHANGSLYLDNQVFSSCSGRLVGAVALNNFNIIACAEDLILLTDEGELVERIRAPFSSYSQQGGEAVPFEHQAIGVCSPLLCIQTSGDRVYSFDLDDLSIKRIPKNEQALISWSSLNQELPAAIITSWNKEHLGQEITWERLILDLHAGRFLGAIGPWFMDVIALIFIILAATGTYLWLKGDRKKSARS